MYSFNRAKFRTSTVPVLNQRDLLRASAALDFASIAAGAEGTLTIAVPGAAVGDDVILHLTAAPSTVLVLDAYVSAADEVTVRATNLTAGPIDQASTTYRVTVLKAD